jgi:hypothetical protein
MGDLYIGFYTFKSQYAAGSVQSGCARSAAGSADGRGIDGMGARVDVIICNFPILMQNWRKRLVTSLYETTFTEAFV